MNAIEQLHNKFMQQSSFSSARRKAFNNFAALAIRDTNDGFRLLAQVMHSDEDEAMRRRAALKLMRMILMLNGVQLEQLQAWFHESIEDDGIRAEAMFGWQMCEEALNKLAGAAD